MAIRAFRMGDEASQVSVYNEAAAELPKFKPASLDDVRRRRLATDFDHGGKSVAEVGGRIVGYAGYQGNGRVSFPWCRKGHEDQAEPLFHAVFQAMRERGISRAFAAYRADWKPQCEFFTSRGFRLSREMINFLIDLADMPTPAASPSAGFATLVPADVPEVLGLSPQALRVSTTQELERHLLHNAYFKPEAVFVRRGRNGAIAAVGVLVEDPKYADPNQLDSAMPCFRLGAFGTESMSVKRINGLFSFLARPGNDVNPLGLSLLGEASYRLRNTELDCLAAQVPSDVPHLLRFYQQYFRRQGSFPVFERELVLG
jgi:hypothetical protein